MSGFKNIVSSTHNSKPQVHSSPHTSTNLLCNKQKTYSEVNYQELMNLNEQNFLQLSVPINVRGRGCGFGEVGGGAGWTILGIYLSTPFLCDFVSQSFLLDHVQ